MKRYLKLTSQLISNFNDVRIGQIPREENSEADKPGLYMEVQTIPSIEGLDVVYVQSKGNWMDPILVYIRDGRLSFDLSKASKIRVRSSRFTILNDKLQKRGFS